ncbi:hypothetical protein J6590_082333 [Homalodisca vitripennis]|nr:hypothetical protein J6590_082333 [Homalodisca vitripennis]
MVCCVSARSKCNAFTYLNSDDICHVRCKAYKCPGLICCYTAGMKNPEFLKLLYLTAVHPNPGVQFRCIVPYIKSTCNKSYRVFKHARLRFAFKEVPVEELVVKLDLQPLSTRRKVQDILASRCGLQCTMRTRSRRRLFNSNYDELDA